MIIPNFGDTKLVDENGYMTQEWANILIQLITELQLNLSDEGFVIPQQPTDNIDQLTGEEFEGRIIYDSDTNEMKVNIDGTWEVLEIVP